MVVGIRVEAENIKTGIVKHCNSSYFTMVAKNDQGKNVAVPGLILETEDDVRRFVRSIERKREQNERTVKYGAEFSIKDHLKMIENLNNVQISL
jgi:acyl-CoA hydrolase